MNIVVTNLFIFLIFTIYFDFMPSRFVAVSNASLSVRMHSKVSDVNYYKNFKIRPVAKKALVSVFSERADGWITQYALSTQLPDYEQNILIRPIFNGEYFSLSFDVLDTSTGKIYKTPEKKIWGLVVPKSVLSRLVIKQAPD